MPERGGFAVWLGILPGMDMQAIRRHRMRNQRLVGPPFPSPDEMVRSNVAVQAQDYAGAKWGIAQRCEGVDDFSLDELFNAGTLLRTHLMRPTWHFVLPEDIRWLLDLTAPRVHATNAGRYRQLELDAATLARANYVLAGALAGGTHRTRAELAEALRSAGIGTEGQRLAYMLMHAELDGVICSGPRRGRQFTYAVLEERVPPGRSMDRDEAVAELVRRYVRSHGPATPHDFAWWSGLTVGDARRGLDTIRADLEQVTIDGTTWWLEPDVHRGDLPRPRVHLLPNYDEYFIGFKHHAPVFDPETRDRYDHDRDYWAAHLIALDGMLVGGWRRSLSAREVRVEPLLPAPLDPTARDALTAAADRFGRFLGLPAVIDA